MKTFSYETILLILSVGNLLLGIVFQRWPQKKLVLLGIVLIGMPMMIFKEIFILNYTFHWLYESTRRDRRVSPVKRVMSHSATLLQLIRCLDFELSHVSGAALIYWEMKARSLVLFGVVNTVPAALILAANCYLSHYTDNNQRRFIRSNFNLF